MVGGGDGERSLEGAAGAANGSARTGAVDEELLELASDSSEDELSSDSELSLDAC